MKVKWGVLLTLGLLASFVLTAQEAPLPPMPAPTPSVSKFTPKEDEPLTPEEEALQDVWILQRKLEEVAMPLLVGAGRVNTRQQRYHYGFTVHDVDFYGLIMGHPLGKNAPLNPGIGKVATVAYVHPEMPAATAGLREGDVLLAVNGRKVENVSAFEIRRWLRQLGEKQEEALEIAIARDERILTFSVPGRKGAGLDVQYRHEQEADTYTKNDHIFITRGMLEMMGSPSDRAFVLSREIARHLMRHSERALGLSVRDAFTKRLMGTTPFAVIKHPTIPSHLAALEKKLQTEADRLGVHLCSVMGFDTSGILALVAKLDAKANENYTAKNPLTPTRVEALKVALSDLDDANNPFKELD